MKNGYVDCGAGFVNSLEDLPLSVECCQSQQAGLSAVLLIFLNKEPYFLMLIKFSFLDQIF